MRPTHSPVRSPASRVRACGSVEAAPRGAAGGKRFAFPSLAWSKSRVFCSHRAQVCRHPRGSPVLTGGLGEAPRWAEAEPARTPPASEPQGLGVCEVVRAAPQFSTNTAPSARPAARLGPHPAASPKCPKFPPSYVPPCPIPSVHKGPCVHFTPSSKGLGSTANGSRRDMQAGSQGKSWNCVSRLFLLLPARPQQPQAGACKGERTRLGSFPSRPLHSPGLHAFGTWQTRFLLFICCFIRCQCGLSPVADSAARPSYKLLRSNQTPPFLNFLGENYI